LLVCGPGVVKRIVDMRYWFGEVHRITGAAQITGCFADVIRQTHRQMVLVRALKI